MKLAQQWRDLQARGFEQVAENAVTTVQNIVTRSLAERDSSSTCKSDDTSAQCQKPTASGNTQTIAIVLGAGIPLACAAIVLVFLHRRHVKNQRLEDINDPHKSLDFGMGNTPGMNKWDKQKQGIPEMTVTDLGSDPMKPGQRPRGMSMDMGSPYLLPAELNDSHGSIHSMSRASFQDEHDPYRPVAFLKSDAESMRSGRRPGDNGSVYSAATSLQSSREDAGLIANAQRMSRSFPQRGESRIPSSPLSPQSPTGSDELPTRQMHSQIRGVPPSRKPSGDSGPVLPVIQEPERAHSPNTFVPPPPPPPPEEKASPPPRTSSASAGSAPRPVRKESMPAPARESAMSSNYGDIAVTPASPPASIPRIESSYDMDIIDAVRHSLDGPEPSANLDKPITQNPRLSVMGLRPLPNNVPDDNPEQRANRIRSFYKEYFDDSKPNPAGPNASDASMMGDGAIYDPETGGFITAHRPFAQPIGRRAMTPPPRGSAPRTPGPFNPHRRHNSTQSAAGRGGPRGRAPPMPMPKKRAPPPAPLKSLPTPHLLKDDTAIFNADDFAPPVSYRDRQAGRRPDSPLGSARPYSPAVSPHIPLQSTMQDLAPIPSPYLLRKSGTFTSLDFAPPGRIGGGEGGSDTGSIRSNRSGVSALQTNAIRGGAYRVSRLPADMVGTKDDLSAQLKPSWNMRRGDNIMG